MPWDIPGSFLRLVGFAIIIVANVLYVLLKSKVELRFCDALAECIQACSATLRAGARAVDGSARLEPAAAGEMRPGAPGRE